MVLNRQRHRDLLALAVSVIAALGIAFVVGDFVSTAFHSAGHDWAYLIGGAIGFVSGFLVGWLTSKVVRTDARE